MEVKKIHDRLLNIFSQQPKERRSKYTEERRQQYNFTIHSSLDETSKNTKEYIVQLVEMDQGLDEMEIIGFAMLMDEIDYGFACCLMFCPQSPERVEKDVLRDDICRVVNSLSEEFKVDPFTLEDNLKTKYQSLDLHRQLHCARILSAKVQQIAASNEQ